MEDCPAVLDEDAVFVAGDDGLYQEGFELDRDAPGVVVEACCIADDLGECAARAVVGFREDWVTYVSGKAVRVG